MHGMGTLSLKTGNKTYTGDWVDGICAEFNSEILGIEQGWIYMAEMKEEDEKKRLIVRKQRIADEQAQYEKENDA